MFVMSRVIHKLVGSVTLCNTQKLSQLGCVKPHTGILSCLGAVQQEQSRSKSQMRGRYPCWRMWRDVQRRDMVKEYAHMRTRLNSIRKNDLLPRDIQDIASEELHNLPRNSCRLRLVNRCIISSRPRNVMRHWRLGRMNWRHLADYNHMCGVTRATW